MGNLLGLSVRGRSWRGRRRWWRWRGAARDGQRDGGAAAGFRVDRQLAVDLGRALFHANDAVMAERGGLAGGDGGARDGRVAISAAGDAAAVVADSQRDVVVS